MDVVFWTLVAFLAGSIPFSWLIARYILGVNIRTIGDGNPGATNVGKAGGLRLFIAAFLLDYFKAALPVGVAHFFAGITGAALWPIAVAPVLGHAFSPFLGFRGGKALAATFGVWTGLTIGEVPTMLGILMVMMVMVTTVNAWGVLSAYALLLPYFTLIRPNPLFVAVWAGVGLILVYKHHADLRQPLRLKTGLFRTAKVSKAAPQ
jgi:glycerol-3-phosphate acyltransferase PlsY